MLDLESEMSATSFFSALAIPEDAETDIAGMWTTAARTEPGPNKIGDLGYASLVNNSD